MVDQEEARLENSEAILRNLVSEFKAQGIKIKIVDEDTIAYKGVQFDLLDSPTDTLNGIIYLESPSRQVIPIREENLVEGVESIMQYVESQKENPLRKWKKVKMSKNIRGHLDDADQIRQPIRDWYTSAYPDDDLGMNLSDITFHDLHTGISQGLDVYDHIGVGDSIVRERLFERLAELKSVSYNTIYDMWLNGARKGMRKSKKLSKNESMPSFSQMMKSVKDGSFKAKEISKGASAYAIFEIDGYDERLTRAQSLEGFYSPNVGGHIQTYERGIDVPVMGDVFVSASDIRSEMDYAIQDDFEEIKREVCEAYNSVYNDVPIESIVYQGYAISNVFVVTEGVSSYARTFSISGGYSHIHLPLGAQIECEGSWFLDVLVALRFEVNGELIVESYESTISVDPVLRLHPQGIDAYNTLWESNDDMYM